MDNTAAAYSVPPATGAALGDTLTLVRRVLSRHLRLRSRQGQLADQAGRGRYGGWLETLCGISGDPPLAENRVRTRSSAAKASRLKRQIRDISSPAPEPNRGRIVQGLTAILLLPIHLYISALERF
jgi:hypothetical protein